MLKTAIFDFDGVLVDTEPLHYRAFQEVLGPLGLGHSYDRYLEEFIGYDDRDAFREAFRDAGRTLDALFLAELMEAKARAFMRIVARGVQSFPGAGALVHSLVHHGVGLAIASGALRHEIDMILAALGFQTAFPVIIAADDVGRSKPDPETYLSALERLGVRHGNGTAEPPGCLAIEDTPAGVASAKAAGIPCIAVTHSFPAASLAEADWVVDSLKHLNFGRLSQWLAARSRQLRAQQAADTAGTN
jgi:beta-phosphoglucomutase